MEKEDNLGSFIFDDDLIEFEPYKTFKSNFFHWFKPYMRSIFSSQSRRKIIDVKLHKDLIKKYSSKNDLEYMREIINDLAKNGFKGPKSYFNPIYKFFYFLTDNKIKSFTDIKNNTIKYFLVNELEEFSYAYKKSILVAIKNFLLFIESKNYIKNGDSHFFKLDKSLIKAISKERKPIAYLDPETEFGLFLDTVSKMKWKKDSCSRNKAMLKILLITGVRVSELTNIRKNDIKVVSNSYEITIIGKGNKKRLVYIAKNLIQKEFEELFEDNKEFLFTTRTGKKINDRYLNTIVEQVMLEAGIPKKEKNGPHMLRHSCATWLNVVAGYDISKLQAYMAHEDISTTKKYVHLNEKVVRDMSEKVSGIIEVNIHKKEEVNE